MPAPLRLSSQRLVLVTGKGGVGKSTVAAALGRAAAEAGRRVLAVDVGGGGLTRALATGEPPEGEPVRIGPRLWLGTIDPETALGDAVHGMLRLGMIARRLLRSTTFQVVAAAAPGLPEYLVLHRLSGWLEAARLRRARWDLLVVDAPASGHSLPLLSAPRALGALARFGPAADFLARMDRVLRDADATSVWLVTTPEELAVRETIELHRTLREELRLPVAPPIVNALPRRRFSGRDEAALGGLEAAHPYVVGARLEIARLGDALAQVRALHRATRRTPARLPLVPGAETAGAALRLRPLVARHAGLAT